MTNERELLDRITVRPEVFGGKPTIRGMRVAVEHVLGMLAAGDTPATILQEYTFPRTGRHPSLPGICPPLPGRRAGTLSAWRPGSRR